MVEQVQVQLEKVQKKSESLTQYSEILKPKKQQNIQKDKNQQIDPNSQEYWISQGRALLQSGNYQNAQDCFNQALQCKECDENMIYICLAATSEKLNDFRLAYQYYTKAQFINTSNIEAKIGQMVCLYKVGDIVSALKFLKEISVRVISKKSSLSKQDFQRFLYFKAVIYRAADQFEEAKQPYQQLHREIKNSYSHQVLRYLFQSFFTDVFINDKLLIFYKDLQWVLDKSYIPQEELIKSGPKILINQGVGSDICQKLSKKYFFKRFPENYINDIVQYIQPKTFSEQDILFFPRNQVYIQTYGIISLYDHSQNILQPLQKTKIYSGYAFGFNIPECPYDPNNHDLWAICETACEFIVLPSQQFDNLWNMQQRLPRYSIYEFIKNSEFFKGICIQTIYILIFDIGLLEKYQNENVLYTSHMFRDTQKLNFIEQIQSQLIDAKFTKIRQLKLNSEEEASKLTDKVMYKILGKNYDIISRGIHFILSGQCAVYNQNREIIKILQIHEFFGEKTLVGTELIHNLSYVLTQVDNVELLFLSKSSFYKIPKHEKDVIKKNICAKLK